MKVKSAFCSLILLFNVIGTINAKKVLIGISPIRPPFMYIDKNNEIVGYDPDLAREVFKKIGYEAKFIPMQFDGLIPSLTTGKIDMIASGLSITEERKKKIDYSDAYNETGSRIVVKMNSNVKSIKDLKGKKIGVELGTVQLDYAESNEKIYDYKVIIFNGADEMFLDLLKKDGVDAIIENETLTKEYIKKRKAKIKIVGELIKPSRHAFGFKKGNADFVEKINKALKELEENGEKKKIYNKYFN